MADGLVDELGARVTDLAVTNTALRGTGGWLEHLPWDATRRGVDRGAAGGGRGAAWLEEVIARVLGDDRGPGPTGVFVTVSPPSSLSAPATAERDDTALRIAYDFDLRGPASTVFASCAGGLAALVQATRAVLWGDCDSAVAAAVHLPAHSVAHGDTARAAEPDLPRPFDARAYPMPPVPSAAAVLLRPLADAVADGDDIVAVLRGCALRSSGRTSAGYAIPSPVAQAEVLRAALEQSLTAPADVGLVVAHGDATSFGDAVELAAVLDALDLSTTSRGSAPTLAAASALLGNVDAVTGLANVILAARAVSAAQLPPLPGFAGFGSMAPEGAAALRVCLRAAGWASATRVAVALAHGVGGAQGCAVLSEAPQQPSGAPLQ